MNIEIKLYPHRDSNVYYAGEDVTGYLDLWGPFNNPETTVKLTFKGSSEVIQQIKNRDLEDKQIFFQVYQDLYIGALDIPAKENRSFPFKFTLPEQTEPSWGAPKVKISKKKNLYAQGPHPLPPSAALTGGFPHPWSAQVCYQLDVEIKGKRMTTKRKSGVVDVVYSPAQTRYLLEHADTEHDAQSKVFTHASSRLLEGAADKRRTVGTWFSDKLSSSSPKAVFSFTARTATTLSAGQDIPIQITLNYDAKASNLPSIPPFNLVELKYKLRGITNNVARGMLAPDMYVSEKATVFKRQIRFAQMALTDGQALDIGFIDTEQGGLHYIPLDTALVTPFMTYNVSRYYAVEIHIIFQVGGKQMTAQFDWNNVNIVFNESYHLRAATQFGPADKDGNLEGAVGVAKVLGVTALTVAALLGG
jgi:hypothetical protein